VTAVPNYLKRLKADLEEATRARVTVSRGDDAWHVRLAGSRVRLDARYRPDGVCQEHGKCGDEHLTPAGATVWVDGEKHVFKGSSYDFMMLYHYPELLISGGLIPIPALNVTHRVPASVQHFIGILRTKMRKHDVTLQYGWDGHRWVIGFGDADTGIRIFLTKMSKQRWGISQTRGLQLAVNGEDLSDEVDGKLDEAVRLMNRAQQDHGVAGESATGDSAAQANNAVRERRHSVIRN
jgi:hypothetical protein